MTELPSILIKSKVSILQRNLYIHAYCDITYNSQVMELASVFINRWRNKENVIYMYTHMHTHTSFA